MEGPGNERTVEVNRGWVRIVIVVAAAATGALIIANGFGGGAPSVGGQPTTPSTTLSPTPTVSTSPTPTRSQRPGQDCEPEGIHVFVQNATDVEGLAGSAQTRLEAEGFVIDEIGNATTNSATTLAFFTTPADREAAQCVASLALRGLQPDIVRLDPATTIPETTQVTLILGSDYAAEFPVGSE